MEIYLIRHTTPLIERGICYGHTDLPLAPSFSEEWEVLSGKIPAEFDAVYTSPAQRCIQLARRLKAPHRETRPCLWELNFGDWEMKRWDEISREAIDVWMKDILNTRVPNGESYSDLFLRVSAFWNDLQSTSFNRVAVVAHAGSIRAIVALFLELAADRSFQLHLDYGKVSLVETSGELKKLKYFNL